MSRQTIRTLKRAVSAGQRPSASASSQLLARESAAQLLDRSVRFGHSRLAVKRLLDAVEAGATVLPAHWTYCQLVVEKAGPGDLDDLFCKAVQLACTPR